MRTRFLRFAIPLFVCAAAGCGSSTDAGFGRPRPKVFPANGVVTFNGAPVENALVVFEGQSHPAHARTNAEGKFKLTTFADDDGAIAGAHTVTIKKVTTRKTAPIVKDADDGNPDRKPGVQNILPIKYGRSAESGLTATVQENGENRFSFALVGATPL